METAMENQPVMTDVWAIHSDSDGRPMMRGWARGEASAKARLEEIRNGDGVKDERYWVSRLEQNQLEALQGSGLIPQNA